MSEIKFACPQCSIHISCDEAWAGQQIACPGCQVGLIVPQAAAPAPMPAPAPVAAEPSSLVPTPPAQSQSRLSIRSHQPAPVAAPLAAPPPGHTPVYRSFPSPEPEKGGSAMKILKIAALIIVLGVGGFFGFRWVLQIQAKTNAEMAEAAKNSDGGEAGHIAGLYSALDITDPEHPGMTKAEYDKSKREDEAAERRAQAEKNKPVIPPVYTMDVAAAVIPESKVNGTHTGSNFVGELVLLPTAKGGAQAIRFLQGDPGTPMRDIYVYVRLRPGETLSKKTITVAMDSKAATNPGITKRWRSDPKLALATKSFTSGYALKLELGEQTYEGIKGKIYLALPDAEKTVIAGSFEAEVEIDPATRGGGYW